MLVVESGRERVVRVGRAHGLGEGKLSRGGLGRDRIVGGGGHGRWRVVGRVRGVEEVVGVYGGRLLAGL